VIAATERSIPRVMTTMLWPTATSTIGTAVFTIGAGPVTWALIVSVALAPFARAPVVHTPETASYVP
jgi:hypothetical protein